MSSAYKMIDISLFCWKCGRTNTYSVPMGIPYKLTYVCKCGNKIPWQSYKDGDPEIEQAKVRAKALEAKERNERH